MGTIAACPECGNSLNHAEGCKIGTAIAARNLRIATRARGMTKAVAAAVLRQTTPGYQLPTPLLVNEIMIVVAAEIDALAVFLVQEIQKAERGPAPLKPPELVS